MKNKKYITNTTKTVKVSIPDNWFLLKGSDTIKKDDRILRPDETKWESTFSYGDRKISTFEGWHVIRKDKSKIKKIKVEDVDWSLLPSWANQLVMDKDGEWSVGDGRLEPHGQGNWVRYSTGVRLPVRLENLDLPFEILPVKNWMVSYKWDGTKKEKDTDFVSEL